MTSAKTPSLGSVIWAEIADPNGQRKVRPAVVVSIDRGDVSAPLAYIVAVTTRIPTPLPGEYVLLPWSPQGSVRTGLRKKSAAVTNWIVSVPYGGIQEVVGVVPPEVLNEILAKVPTQ